MMIAPSGVEVYGQEQALRLRFRAQLSSLELNKGFEHLMLLENCKPVLQWFHFIIVAMRKSQRMAVNNCFCRK